MNHSAILLPVFVMIALTVAVGVIMLKRRYRAVRVDKVNPRYFALNRGAKMPDYVVKVTQHYDNLFETPVLFYVAILLLVTLNIVDVYYVLLAWGYVLARIGHAVVHITYNRILHRKNIFIISIVVLVILWIRLAFDVLINQ